MNNGTILKLSLAILALFVITISAVLVVLKNETNSGIKTDIVRKKVSINDTSSGLIYKRSCGWMCLEREGDICYSFKYLFGSGKSVSIGKSYYEKMLSKEDVKKIINKIITSGALENKCKLRKVMDASCSYEVHLSQKTIKIADNECFNEIDGIDDSYFQDNKIYEKYVSIEPCNSSKKTGVCSFSTYLYDSGKLWFDIEGSKKTVKLSEEELTEVKNKIKKSGIFNQGCSDSYDTQQKVGYHINIDGERIDTPYKYGAKCLNEMREADSLIDSYKDREYYNDNNILYHNKSELTEKCPDKKHPCYSYTFLYNSGKLFFIEDDIKEFMLDRSEVEKVRNIIEESKKMYNASYNKNDECRVLHYGDKQAEYILGDNVQNVYVTLKCANNSLLEAEKIINSYKSVSKNIEQ